MGSGITIRGQNFDINNFSMAAMSGIVTERATRNLPQTATEALFSVSGLVRILSIVGVVTTAIQAQADLAKLQANPNVAGTSVDICADLDLTGKVVGSLLGITGIFANAMVAGLAIPMQGAAVVAQAGSIDLVCSASNTGAASWTVRWFPMADGALLTPIYP